MSSKSPKEKINTTKQSISSISVQPPSSRADSSYCQSITINYPQAHSGCFNNNDNGGYNVLRNSSPPSINASSHGHHSEAQYGAHVRMNAPDYGYYASEKFATQVVKGAISLGIDVSPALQLSFVDQHGCLIGREPVYSTAEEIEQFLKGPQSLAPRPTLGASGDKFRLHRDLSFRFQIHGNRFILFFWKPFRDSRAGRARRVAKINLTRENPTIRYRNLDRPKSSENQHLSSSSCPQNLEFSQEFTTKQPRVLFSADLLELWAPPYSFEYDYVNDLAHPSFQGSYLPTHPSVEYDYSCFSPLGTSSSDSSFFTATSADIPQGDPSFQTLELSHSQEPVLSQELVHHQAPTLFPTRPYLEASSEAICSLSTQGQDSVTDNGRKTISSDLAQLNSSTSDRMVLSQPVCLAQESPASEESHENTCASTAPRRRRKHLQFKCCACPETFTRRRDLNKHLMTHDYPFKCSSCPKGFSRLCDLNKHRKTHERPFKCTIAGCGGMPGFALPKDLRRHIDNVHCKSTFTCYYQNCAKTFSRSDNCQRHIEEQHLK
ncbi:hypothetical protein V490_03346 [Pseudogymnoascus sp. VKM F-3557]|nr:hypothetical protein V490_03346 [Pseudogymnoascus sp. VKM F-3557]